ncbi:MAG: heavy-metal-associated domain-containing protein [Deltaproteobacteria bacterium]|nr:heavy-metal-associated domain-containing protein [Deltaproteobacteria bacterium]
MIPNKSYDKNFKAKVALEALKFIDPSIAIALSLILVATSVLAAPASYRLRVDGLACPFCAYGIEKKLGALEGVQSVETHIKDGVVIVTMKGGVTLDEATAKKAVKEAGFNLRSFEQTQAAPQSTPGGQAN